MDDAFGFPDDRPRAPDGDGLPLPELAGLDPEALDRDARLAVEVALATAGAFGDPECGTAHLLFGVAATARGESADLLRLFALDPLRVERALHDVRYQRIAELSELSGGEPELTPAALATLRQRRRDDGGPTGLAEILYGIVENPDGDAVYVLRHLGVDPGEFARLAAFGTWHLGKDEAESLVSTLDRRSTRTHQPWWGPTPGATMHQRLARQIELATSRSSRADLESLRIGGGGAVVMVNVSSLTDWVLDPTLTPRESLVPGEGARFETGPEHLRVSVATGAHVLSNDVVVDRWAAVRPSAGVLVPLGHKSETISSTDRRSGAARTVRTAWWAWPIDPDGPLEVSVDWPAEVLHGAAVIDAAPANRSGSTDAPAAR